jgi:uncharacterized membrane protein
MIALISMAAVPVVVYYIAVALGVGDGMAGSAAFGAGVFVAIMAALVAVFREADE